MKREDRAKRLDARAGRADRLRRACHALRPSDARPCRLPSARRLRDLVSSVRAAASAGTPGAVEALDRQLDDATLQVVASVAEISLAQLRATLPEVRDRHPEEIAALIDVCLEVLDTRPELWGALEYLITLLASTANAGRRELTSDPSMLTEALQARCAALLPEDSSPIEALRGEFLDAIDELEQTLEIAPILERLRARKDEHRAWLLFPDLLRALVAYNIAIGNRVATLLGAEKALDAADQADAHEESGTSALVRSILAHAGVRMLHRGIASHANGIAVEPGAVFRIVSRLALDRLDARESNLLLAESEQTSATDEAVLAAIVLGLLDERHAQVSDEDLEELLLERDALTREWIPELEVELGRCIETALSAGNETLAQQLAESKTKYLGHRRRPAP